VLGPSSPEEDIDPVDASAGKLHVFDGKLHFLENKVIKTYHRVRAYEIDVNRRVAELRSETRRTKWTSEVKFKKFVEDHKVKLNGKTPPTEAEFTEAANNDGHYRPRKEMRQAWRNAFGPRPRGPRPKNTRK
jgi:hypothetical protein